MAGPVPSARHANLRCATTWWPRSRLIYRNRLGDPTCQASRRRCTKGLLRTHARGTPPAERMLSKLLRTARNHAEATSFAVPMDMVRACLCQRVNAGPLEMRARSDFPTLNTFNAASHGSMHLPDFLTSSAAFEALLCFPTESHTTRLLESRKSTASFRCVALAGLSLTGLSQNGNGTARTSKRARK